MKDVLKERLTIYRRPTLLWIVLGVTIIYIVTGKFGLSLAFANPSASAIWAPTGIAIAALLIFGFRLIPAIFIGAFVVNILTAGTILSSVFIAIGNTLEAITAAYFIKQFANGTFAFSRVSDIFKFTIVILCSAAIAATVGVLTLVGHNLASWESFSAIWLTWWLGDVGGGVIIAPFILVWWTHHRIPFSISKAFHLLLCILAIYLVNKIIFSGVIPYPYLYTPLAIWIAFWFGRRGASSATLIVAAFTITYTLSGTGPFVRESLNDSLIQLQIFLSTFSLTALSFATTVLELRKGQQQITSHEERFKALIENSFDAVVLVDPTSKILYASPATKRVLGYSPEELVGTTGFDLIDPQDRQKTMGLLAQLVLKPKGIINTHYRAIKKDKSVIWVEATGTNLLFEPSVNAVVVNFRDITNERRAKERLFQEKMEDEAMLTSIGDGIIATDETGRITMVNQVTCDTLGWKEKELLGQSIVDTFPMVDDTGKTIPIEERPITKVLTLGKRYITSRVINYVKRDGSMLPVHMTVTPISLANRVVGIIEVFHDITKEKEIDKAKTEFVSVASHQLRTPLATINWYLEELIRTGENLSDKQKSYFNEVHLASKRMIALVNDLLNVSRIELGTFPVEPKETNLEELIDQVLKDLSSQIDKKHITVQKTYQPNLPLFSVDPKLFTIIMQNLISNALKYSKLDGTITIKMFSNETEFLVSVTDNGYGIPKEQQTKIFTKLFRADNARQVVPEGTGLGLYIVNEIIKATGGKIWFNSVENKGAIFSVVFPLKGMQQKQGGKALR